MRIGATKMQQKKVFDRTFLKKIFVKNYTYYLKSGNRKSVTSF